MHLRGFVIVLLVLVAGVFQPTWAQRAGQITPGTEGVGLDDHIGQDIPLDLTFTDEKGTAVRLGDYFAQGKPVIISLVYFDCPMLCNLILDGFTRGLKAIPQVPGKDFTIVTVSFAPGETAEQAQRQKARHIQLLEKPEAASGWHFLTGSEENIFALADAIGFRYRWDEPSQQYAHPAALTFVQPDGTISRYLAGTSFEPTDLRAALSEASDGKTGTFVDQFIMFCFQYDAAQHTYAIMASRLMMIGGVLTLVLLGLMLTILARRHHTASPLAT